MYSQSEENYLKAIYHLEESSEKGVSTSKLSEELQTKAASVTEMLKRLAEKKLVNYQKYYGVSLTPKGKSWALAIIRKHRLWEYFLVEYLNFNWDEVHEVAEQLEHIQSKKLVEELDCFLGRPSFDPHGDPIPNAAGVLPEFKKRRLSEFKVGDALICKGFSDASSSFLQFLDQHKIGLDTLLSIKSIQEFDESMLVKVGNNEIMLSKTATQNIFVEIYKESKLKEKV